MTPSIEATSIKELKALSRATLKTMRVSVLRGIVETENQIEELQDKLESLKDKIAMMRLTESVVATVYEMKRHNEGVAYYLRTGRFPE